MKCSGSGEVRRMVVWYYGGRSMRSEWNAREARLIDRWERNGCRQPCTITMDMGTRVHTCGELGSVCVCVMELDILFGTLTLQDRYELDQSVEKNNPSSQ